MLNASNYTTPIDLFRLIDDQSTAYGFHVFGIAILIMITAVIFLSLKRYTSARAFAPTFAITTVLALFFYILNWIDFIWVVVYVIGFVFSVVALRHESSR